MNTKYTVGMRWFHFFYEVRTPFSILVALVTGIVGSIVTEGDAAGFFIPYAVLRMGCNVALLMGYHTNKASGLYPNWMYYMTQAIGWVEVSFIIVLVNLDYFGRRGHLFCSAKYLPSQMKESVGGTLCGRSVFSKKYGAGKVTRHDGNTIFVKFSSLSVRYPYPTAFERGGLQWNDNQTPLRKNQKETSSQSADETPSVEVLDILSLEHNIETKEPYNHGQEIARVAAIDNITPLLKRVFILLEDGERECADNLCEKILNSDPENPLAYLAKLLSEMKISKKEDLARLNIKFYESNNYKRAVKYAPLSLKEELESYARINKRKIQCQERIQEETKQKQKEKIVSISKILVVILIIVGLLTSSVIFVVIPSIRYAEAERMYENGMLKEAHEIFYSLGSFRDSSIRSASIERETNEKYWVQLDGIVVRIPSNFGCSATSRGNRIVLEGAIPSVNEFLEWLSPPEGKNFCEDERKVDFWIENACYGKTTPSGQQEYFDLVFVRNGGMLLANYMRKNGTCPSMIYGSGIAAWVSEWTKHIYFSKETTKIKGQYRDKETGAVETFTIVVAVREK